MELTFKHWGFEEEVRNRLAIFDRPVTDQDVLSVTQLDLSFFGFLQEDLSTLSKFQNLTDLCIDVGRTTPDFWHTFNKLQYLDIVTSASRFDFSSFKHMKDLTELTVSGGDLSGIGFLNLEVLIPLKKLRFLQLHEFGSADLLPLASMPQLREFLLRYADHVSHIEMIGSMAQLEALTLDGLYVQDLSFLDHLPDHLRLSMCGVHVYGGADPRKWNRFAEHDVCEISVGDNPFGYLDCSMLDPQ